ncbi:MAG: hypothetical protein M3450_08230 [Actinomycetota bacterium]|nr:hypothetical protein [Actinomycetota bacterium]
MTSIKWRSHRNLLASAAICALVVAGASADATAEGTTTTPGGRSIQSQQVRPTITITPRSGPTGTVIIVRGTGCTPPGRALVAMTRNGIEEEGGQFAEPDENGNWSERQTIPGYDPDSAYAVTARCFDGETIRFSYPPQRFDVTRVAPRARPVPARPTFTG